MKSKETNGRIWLEINKNAIKNNFNRVKELVAPLEIMAVLKADSYGLGAAQIAEILVPEGLKFVGVAEPSEGVALEKYGITIQLLGSVLLEEIPLVVEKNFQAPIPDMESAKLLNAEAIRQNKKVKCTIKIDSGMGRLGFFENILENILEIKKMPNIELVGLYSHFPSAYEDHQYSIEQITKIADLIGQLNAKNIFLKQYHIANSDGINNIDEACKNPFNMARTGINLYGVNELQGKAMEKLQPAISLKSRVVAVRNLPENFSIGYGRTYRLSKKTKVATVCAGYADGIPASSSNRGWVIINNRLCPVIGKVSMDYLTVIVDNCPNAKINDEVTLLGKSQDYTISVEDWARQIGVSPYHVICSLGKRVHRIYV